MPDDDFDKSHVKNQKLQFVDAKTHPELTEFFLNSANDFPGTRASPPPLYYRAGSRQSTTGLSPTSPDPTARQRHATG
jgi:hypothetical protein